MKSRIVFILLVVAAGAGFWAFRSSSIPRAARPTSGEGIIAFGDSLVAGRGASAGRDFVSLLSQRLGVPIVNAGTTGDTTASALARFDRDVLSRAPRIVIVLLGGNDLLRQVPIDQTFANLQSIVTRLRERGSAVVLVAIGTGLWIDPYAARYEALAKRTASVLVPDILDDIMGHHDLMADQIHPNDRGYDIMATRLEPVLRDLMRAE